MAWLRGSAMAVSGGTGAAVDERGTLDGGRYALGLREELPRMALAGRGMETGVVKGFDGLSVRPLDETWRSAPGVCSPYGCCGCCMARRREEEKEGQGRRQFASKPAGPVVPVLPSSQRCRVTTCTYDTATALDRIDPAVPSARHGDNDQLPPSRTRSPHPRLRPPSVASRGGR
jgi:hypothetical protein